MLKNVNGTHQIRATITVHWKGRNSKKKDAFEKQLETNVRWFNTPKEKKQTLKVIFGVDKDAFIKNYHIGIFKGTTAQHSYIIKQDIGEGSETSLDLFNNKDHIKSHVKEIIRILKKEAGLNSFRRKYQHEIHYSICEIPFSRFTFLQSARRNASILLTLLVTPIVEVISYFSDKKDKYFPDYTDMGPTLAGSISWSKVWLSILVVVGIYIIISVTEWRNEKNEIRI